MENIIQHLEALYRQDGPGLLKFIRGRGGGNRSEDLLQETFVRALENPERISNARKPRAWLYGVARHVVSEFRRKQSRLTELEMEPIAPPDTEEDPRMQQVRAAMNKLPTDQREALQLRLENELSYEEIAAALNIPVGTVRSRLHHAIRRLREAVGHKGGGK